MEEKDVTFNFVISEPDKDGNQKIGITSDIDDCNDYLSVEEKMCLVLELITQCGRQIIEEKLDDTVEEYDEENNDQNEVRQNLHKFQEETIYLLLNAIHNLGRAKFDMGPEALEYSLVTYKTTLNSLNFKHIHRTVDTYHSPEVDAVDPMQASFDLFTDTIFCLLDDGVPKSEVRSLIDGSMEAMKKDFMNIINEFEKEE